MQEAKILLSLEPLLLADQMPLVPNSHALATLQRMTAADFRELARGRLRSAK